MTRVVALLLCTTALTSHNSFTNSSALDSVIEQAISAGEIPGAVVMVGVNGQIVHHKAYGSKAVEPAPEPMTLDTVFDAASLTKVVATSTSIMKLVEAGKIRLPDKVTVYLPEFQGGSSDITVRNLLTHFSGLRADVDLRPEWAGYDTGVHRALVDVPVAAPGTKFIYSDINFILLGEIVRRVSGMPLEEFARREIFEPLGMKDTTFKPALHLTARIAPTERVNGIMLRGAVHDETTRFMGGVAGHAGMFSTAADLARFAQMMLNRGELDGVRVLSELGVETLTRSHSPDGHIMQRGLGWDIDSPYSSPRGDLFPVGGYGHTGFTGTSMWIDPSTRSFVILMSNAVHPVRKGAITSLRARVANTVAAGLGLHPPILDTRTGLDVLAEQQFAPLRGHRIGLITNHTGISREGKRNVDLMRAASVDVRALLSPEHGMGGTEDREDIADARDAATGLPVYSLYKAAGRRPTEAMLEGIDTLVFDIQDIGTRFYTYVCTMRYAMEEAAKHRIRFVVLDRPNPITGTHVEGPMLDAGLESFIGCHSLPVRHGMTAGELARLFNDSLQPKAELEVIAMRNWRRDAWWDQTGLPWVNPSPNIRSLNAALLYPGIALLEFSKGYSVGRGTDAPFEQVSAPWIDERLARELNALNPAGVRCYPIAHGTRFVVTDRDAFRPVRFGLALAATLQRLYPGNIRFGDNLKLIGSRSAVAALDAARIPDATAAGFGADRSKYLLY